MLDRVGLHRIGTNAPKVLEPWRVINSKGNGPFAVKTLLGWVINGPLGHKEFMSDCHPVLVNRIAISSLEEILTQQYNQDFAEQHYERQEMSGGQAVHEHHLRLCSSKGWALLPQAALS